MLVQSNMFNSHQVEYLIVLMVNYLRTFQLTEKILMDLQIKILVEMYFLYLTVVMVVKILLII